MDTSKPPPVRHDRRKRLTVHMIYLDPSGAEQRISAVFSQRANEAAEHMRQLRPMIDKYFLVAGCELLSVQFEFSLEAPWPATRASAAQVLQFPTGFTIDPQDSQFSLLM